MYSGRADSSLSISLTESPRMKRRAAFGCSSLTPPPRLLTAPNKSVDPPSRGGQSATRLPASICLVQLGAVRSVLAWLLPLQDNANPSCPRKVCYRRRARSAACRWRLAGQRRNGVEDGFALGQKATALMAYGDDLRIPGNKNLDDGVTRWRTSPVIETEGHQYG